MENINLFKEILKEIGLNLKHESSRTNSYDNGEFQQNEIVSKLSKNKTFVDNFNIFSIEQYLCMHNKVWEPYLDSVYGDLVITNKECVPLFYIDLKVSMSPKYYGSVTILSLFNFGDINNDGKQTPMKGHPVFIAQHATGTCCRGCLEKWHKISKGVALTDNQVNYVVALIMEWIKKELEN